MQLVGLEVVPLGFVICQENLLVNYSKIFISIYTGKVCYLKNVPGINEFSCSSTNFYTQISLLTCFLSLIFQVL